MQVGSIVQHKQRLLKLGAGLRTFLGGIFGRERQPKFLVGVPGSICAHRHRIIRHLHKVRIRFRLSQLFRFSFRHQLVQALQ